MIWVEKILEFRDQPNTIIFKLIGTSEVNGDRINFKLIFSEVGSRECVYKSWSRKIFNCDITHLEADDILETNADYVERVIERLITNNYDQIKIKLDVWCARRNKPF